MEKKTLLIITAVLLLITSCKKNKDEVKSNIKSLFSDTTWVGEFKYASRPIAEPFCIQFDAAGTFTWHELEGDFQGTYSINNDAKTVTLTFGNGGSSVTATVTNNNKLINFQYGAAYTWVINNTELLTSSVPELTGTTWKGDNGIKPINIKFLSATKLTYDGGLFAIPSVSYQLKKASLRFSPTSRWKFFGVFFKGKITGIEYLDESAAPDYYKKWEAAKQ